MEWKDPPSWFLGRAARKCGPRDSCNHFEVLLTGLSGCAQRRISREQVPVGEGRDLIECDEFVALIVQALDDVVERSHRQVPISAGAVHQDDPVVRSSAEHSVYNLLLRDIDAVVNLPIVRVDCPQGWLQMHRFNNGFNLLVDFAVGRTNIFWLCAGELEDVVGRSLYLSRDLCRCEGRQMRMVEGVVLDQMPPGDYGFR